MQKHQSDSDFINSLNHIKHRIDKVNSLFNTTKEMAQLGKIEEAYKHAFDLEEETEKLALMTRILPAFTGYPTAIPMVNELLVTTIPVRIGFTIEGWFTVIMPALLPKKEKGSSNYIRGFLYPAMSRFFYGKQPKRYKDCVLIFRHIYNQNRPERSFRDHDNIELNMVVDIVALYVLTDDSPIRCSHYYCSSKGKEDITEVFVVPQIEFETWLEQNHSDRELILYEKCPEKCSEKYKKDMLF